MARIRYEAVEAKTVLNRVKAPSMPFEWSLNPYRGCQHGCSFCYARSTHTFLGMSADDTFQKHILIKKNAAESLARHLEKLKSAKKGGVFAEHVAVGTATDPYQPVEAKAMLTRSCLQILQHHRISVSITTRSPLILRDIDILREMPAVSVNVSINTLNEAVWKQLEPASPHPKKRLETVQQLAENGIHAGIFLAPIVPYLTDRTDDLHELIRSAAQHKAQFVIPSILRLNGDEVRNWFFQTLERIDCRLLPKYRSLYLRSAAVPRNYREPLMRTVAALLQKYGLSDQSPETSSSTAGSGATPANGQPVQLEFSF